MSKFSENLRRVRNEEGITQEELAKEVFVSRATVANWERGFRQPDYINLIGIAKIFGVSVDYLLGIKE